MTKKLIAAAIGVASLLFAKAARLEAQHEGRRTHVYDDHDGAPLHGMRRRDGIVCIGHPTVGIGANLDRSGARAALEAVGANYDAVRNGDADLTDPQIDTLFASDLNGAIAQARRDCQSFDDLPAAVQLALVDMAFNMGSVSGFPRMLAAIERRDWRGMIREMLNSKWAQKDVPTRAKHDVAMLQEALDAHELDVIPPLSDDEKAKVMAMVAIVNDEMVDLQVHDTELDADEGVPV